MRLVHISIYIIHFLSGGGGGRGEGGVQFQFYLPDSKYVK